MARFLAALILCSGALYVTAQDQAGLCPLTAPSSSSSGSKSCSADSGCPSNQKCCTYNSNMRCTDPVIPNYQATFYIAGLPQETNENSLIKSYVETTFANTGTIADIEVERLGTCVRVFVSLQTQNEALVDIKMTALENDPVSINTFTGGPFYVTSHKNESLCPDAIANFNARLYIMGVNGSATTSQAKSVLDTAIGDVGKGWEFGAQEAGECLEIFLEAVLTSEEEVTVMDVLDDLEENGITLVAKTPPFKVTSSTDEAESCYASFFKNDCAAGKRFCPYRKHCILETAFCDGIDDCGDSSDELNCTLDLTTTTTVPPTSTTQTAIRHDVVCGSTSMSFSIPMPANFKQTATLSDPRCQAQTSSNNSLYGSTNLNDCGTTLKVTNDFIVFSNNIILPLDGSSNSSVIRVIPIMCRYDRMTDLTVSAYMPIVRQVLFTETGVGQLSFRIRQYRDSSFSGYVSDSAYPLRLMPSEEVFVQLDLGGQQQPQGFGMDVVRCVASPSPSYMGVLGGMSKENLIDNNCPASTDVHLWNPTISASSNHSLFRFSFKAVTFPDPSDPQRSSTGLVYIHCRVRLCASSECGSGGQCPSPSALSRNKREAEGVEGEAGHQLSTGPLLVDGHSGEPNAFSPLVFVMGAIAACATLVAMVAVVAWRRSRHRGHHQRLQEVTADQQ